MNIRNNFIISNNLLNFKSIEISINRNIGSKTKAKCYALVLLCFFLYLSLKIWLHFKHYIWFDWSHIHSLWSTCLRPLSWTIVLNCETYTNTLTWKLCKWSLVFWMQFLNLFYYATFIYLKNDMQIFGCFSR